MSLIRWARGHRGPLGLALLLSSVALPARALTLDEALASAYQTSPQLAAARAQLRRTDEALPTALAGGRPQLQAQAGVAATTGSSSGGSTSKEAGVGPVASIGAKVPLWTGGRVPAAVASARSQISAGEAELRVSEQDVLLRAATAYLDVLRAQAVLDTERAHEHDLAAELASAERRQAAGLLKATDVAATRAQVAQAQAHEAAAEGDLDAAREVFRGTIGTEPDRLQTPRAPSGLPTTREEAIAQSADNPALIAAGKGVDAARSGVDGARAELRPSLAASGNLGVPASSGEILLTVPLFDGGLAESQARGAEQELAQRRLELDAQRRMVRQDAVAAWQALVTARAGIAASNTQVGAARATRDGLVRERAQGLRTQLEVLQASQQLLDAQLGLLNAEHDSTVAAYRVLAATGQLSAASLGLAVTPYDPKTHAAKVAGRMWDGHEVAKAYLGQSEP